MPKREPKTTQTKVFFVGFDKKLLAYVPENLQESGEFIEQQWVELIDSSEEHCFKFKQDLLKRYENEAKFIIISALHCASPATVLAIPVVFSVQARSKNVL